MFRRPSQELDNEKYEKILEQDYNSDSIDLDEHLATLKLVDQQGDDFMKRIISEKEYIKFITSESTIECLSSFPDWNRMKNNIYTIQHEESTYLRTSLLILFVHRVKGLVRKFC